MSTLDIAMKYAGATGKLLGHMTFLSTYDSLTADEIRAELKAKVAEIEAELGEIEK